MQCWVELLSRLVRDRHHVHILSPNLLPMIIHRIRGEAIDIIVRKELYLAEIHQNGHVAQVRLAVWCQGVSPTPWACGDPPSRLTLPAPLPSSPATWHWEGYASGSAALQLELA